MISRKPLGRGLGALIAQPEISAEGATTIAEVPVDQLMPSPFQPRKSFDPERLAELARAIQSQGIIEPLVVRRLGADRYELIAGERRLRAARMAGLPTVPVVIRELDNRAALEMSLVENIAREELNPIDEARALIRLSREFSLSHEEISHRIGKSRPYVTNAMRLLDLPEEVIEMIAQGKLTPGQARPLLVLPDDAARLEAAQRIVAEAISARGAEALATRHRRARVRSGSTPASDSNPLSLDIHLADLSDKLQRALKRRVRILPAKDNAGRLELEYYGLQDLNSMVEQFIAFASRPR